MAVHAALQAPMSSWRWSWAGLPWRWQALAAHHSCLLPQDREGQCQAPLLGTPAPDCLAQVLCVMAAKAFMNSSQDQ